MKRIMSFDNFLNEGYYDDINGWISTSQNNSGFKEGDNIQSEDGRQKGVVYDVLVSPDKQDFCVVVRWHHENGTTSLGKYGRQHNDINYIKKI